LLGGDPRTNRNFGTIGLVTAGANSWYNSLQVGMAKRFSKGLEFQSSYTWSKLLDETQGQLVNEDIGSSSFGSDPSRRNVDKGLASFDITHNWKLNGIYRFPTLGGGNRARYIVDGWWMSGILSLQSGYPFTPALVANRSRSGVAGGASGIDRPDLVPGRSNSNIVSGTSTGCLGVAPGQQLGTPNLYFDPCAFTIPVLGFLGTAGRNILRGPGLFTVDFALAKDTALPFLGEGRKIEFRAQFFNLLNHANFGLPNRLVFAGTGNVQVPLPTAGVITNTITDSREIEFALRLVF
jgi:hypothetical protein